MQQKNINICHGVAQFLLYSSHSPTKAFLITVTCRLRIYSKRVHAGIPNNQVGDDINMPSTITFNRSVSHCSPISTRRITQFVSSRYWPSPVSSSTFLCTVIVTTHQQQDCFSRLIIPSALLLSLACEKRNEKRNHFPCAKISRRTGEFVWPNCVNCYTRIVGIVLLCNLCCLP